MYRTFAVLFLVICIFSGMALSQKSSRRIALTGNSTVPSSEILKNLGKKCPGVTLTINPANSDYTLEANTENNRYNQPLRYEFTLFDRNGNSIFSTKTRHLSNAVKDVCMAINGAGKVK